MKTNPLSKLERGRFAKEIKSELDILYAQATSNETNALSYLDACKLSDYIESRFLKKLGEAPNVVKGASSLARGLLNPDSMKKGQDLQRGIALLVVTSGGIAILWGLLIALGVGLSVWASLWAAIAGTTGPLTGGITIAVGIAAIIAGIYVAVAMQTPQGLSGQVHKLFIEAIDAWADEEKAKANDSQVRQLIDPKANQPSKLPAATVSPMKKVA